MLSRDARILIVDDLRLVRKLIRDTLTELGFTQVEDATDGTEAFHKLQAAKEAGTPFQLVFCDWNMPVMSGFDFLVKCRADEIYKKLPIIMVTAESDQANVLKALKAGATDYIVKPLSKASLLKKLESIDQWSAKAQVA